MPEFNKMIPELSVTDIERSKRFYMEMCGFALEYERVENRFAFLSLGAAQIMLEQLHGDGWNVAPMSYPFGRGINLQIEVGDVDALYNRLLGKGYPMYRPIMLNRYRADGEYIEQKEFLVQDPDGYLLRFTS